MNARTELTLSIPRPSPSHRLAAILIVALSLAAYLPAFSAGFIWDDPDYVVNNPNLRSLTGLANIWLHPTASPQYYPLVFTTFWFEYQVWGLWAPGYHTVNILLHATGALLAWRLLRTLGLDPRAALLAALLWSLHPVQVESVAWITERKNTLSAIFYFATFLTLWKARHHERPTHEAPPLRRLLLPYLLFIPALASKTVTATLPAAFLLLVYWRTGRLSFRRDVRPVLPLFVMGLAAGLLTAYLERTHVGATGPEWNLSPADRLLVAGRAVVFYLSKLLYPLDLAFIYPRWQIDPAQLWQWLFPAAVLASLLALFILRHRVGRGPFVAAAFFVGTLFPALGFANVYPHRYSFVADHFQHLACLGPLTLIAVLLTRTPLALRGIAVAFLALLTFFQARIYHDPFTLWTDTLAKNPTGWMVHVNLGLTHSQLAKTAASPTERARHDQLAADHMIRAGELAPDIPEALWNAGVAHANSGRPAQAEQLLYRALTLDPNYVPALNSLGLLKLRQSDLTSAYDLLTRATRLQPDFAPAHANLAQTLEAMNQTEPAAREYAAALSLDPNRPAWRLSLARTVAKLARAEPDPARRSQLLTAAQNHYAQALQLDPRNAEARTELAVLLEEAGRPDLAKQIRAPSQPPAPGP